MTKTKPASLAGVFAAKGAAKPADATKPIEAAAVPASAAASRFETPVLPQLFKPVEPSDTSAQVAPPANIPMATKSLTVKVDLTTYTKLKAHGGAQGGKTNQDIFVEALALYFKKYGIQ